MPYASVSDLPEEIRTALPAEAQRQFMAVYNSVDAKGGGEVSAIRQAWGAVKQNWEKGDAGKWVKKLYERELKALSDGLSHMPLAYDPEALAKVRGDQMPRMLGAITHPDRLEDKSFSFDDLTAIQNRVDTAKVTELSALASDGDPSGVVASFGGKNYILDGHHRIIGRWLAGDGMVTTRWIDLNPVSNAMKAAEGEATAITTEVLKVDDSLGLVFGWAIVSKVDGEPYVDTQDDVIPEDVALKAIAKFMEGERVAKAMHVGDRVGQVVMAWPMTEEIMKAMEIQCAKTGVMVAMKPDNPDMLKAYSSGLMTGFSVGGRATYV